MKIFLVQNENTSQLPDIITGKKKNINNEDIVREHFTNTSKHVSDWE